MEVLDTVGGEAGPGIPRDRGDGRGRSVAVVKHYGPTAGWVKWCVLDPRAGAERQVCEGGGVASQRVGVTPLVDLIAHMAEVDGPDPA